MYMKRNMLCKFSVLDVVLVCNTVYLTSSTQRGPAPPAKGNGLGGMHTGPKLEHKEQRGTDAGQAREKPANQKSMEDRSQEPASRVKESRGISRQGSILCTYRVM